MSRDVHSCSHWLRLRNTPPPRIWVHIRGTPVVSKDRRHLLVNPWVLDLLLMLQITSWNTWSWRRLTGSCSWWAATRVGSSTCRTPSPPCWTTHRATGSAPPSTTTSIPKIRRKAGGRSSPPPHPFPTQLKCLIPNFLLTRVSDPYSDWFGYGLIRIRIDSDWIGFGLIFSDRFGFGLIRIQIDLDSDWFGFGLGLIWIRIDLDSDLFWFGLILDSDWFWTRVESYSDWSGRRDEKNLKYFLITAAFQKRFYGTYCTLGFFYYLTTFISLLKIEKIRN